MHSFLWMKAIAQAEVQTSQNISPALHLAYATDSLVCVMCPSQRCLPCGQR